MQTIKVKVWVHIHNLGDGSAAAMFFSSEAAAEKYASHDDERYCDDVYEKELEFDLNGNLVSPDPVHWKDQ